MQFHLMLTKKQRKHLKTSTECPKLFSNNKPLHDHLHNHKFVPNEEGHFSVNIVIINARKKQELNNTWIRFTLKLQPHLCDLLFSCSAQNVPHWWKTLFLNVCEKKSHSKHNLLVILVVNHLVTNSILLNI